MRESDPRRLALEVLTAVDAGEWSDEALDRALEASALVDVDRALATRLVYGVLAHRRSLDHTIAARSSRPLAKLDAVVLQALRLGLFQMAFLDRVPDHAAVMTSVDLVAWRAASAKGFVNALLRRAQREGLVDPPASPVEARLGVRHSHPDWLVRLWIDELGEEETEALLAANNEAAATVARALVDRDEAIAGLRARGVAASPAVHAPSAIVIEGPPSRLEGLAVVQGEASQLVVEMLAPSHGERVLDACAAPGGKTAAIAARVGDTGFVLACDPSVRAGRRLRAVLEAAGVAGRVDFRACRVEALAAPAAVSNEEAGRAFADALAPASFDAVLVDAPCSGLGTLRQHPEIRWRRRPSDLEDLASRQASILDAAAAHVRPGGRLVYSTCTLARAENDDVVDAFLARRPEFSRESPSVPCLAAHLDERGALRTAPHLGGLDGFFAVRLRRA